MMQEWSKINLVDCTSALGDGLHGTPQYTVNGEYAFINGNNLQNRKIVIDNETKRVSIDEYQKYKVPLCERTILISINGTLGNVAVYNGEKIVLGKSACYLNVTEQYDRDFILYIVSSPQFQQYLRMNATGSTIKNVSLKQMREYSFKIPPLPEQERIAEVLATQDRIIELKEKLLVEKINRKKYLMQQLLTGKKRVKGFTGEWKTSILEKSVNIFDNLRVPITKALRKSGKIPYYGANGIQDYVDGFTHNGKFVLVAEDGASDLNDYPIQLVHGKIWVNNHAHVLQGKENIIETAFLSFALKQVDFRPILIGGTRAKLNAGILKRISIFIPPLAEQRAIAEILSAADREIELLQKSIEEEKLKKKSLMQLLLTGIVRV